MADAFRLIGPPIAPLTVLHQPGPLRIVTAMRAPGGGSGGGADGREVELRVFGGFIQWRYEGAASWTNLIALSSLAGAPGAAGEDGAPGADGASVELRADSGFIQWRQVGAPGWTNLLALSSLAGAPGEDGDPGAQGPRGYGAASVCRGRLTTASGQPVVTASRTAQTTLYFTPYEGDEVGLWDGAAWTPVHFAETALALGALAANTNFDVFGYLNAGALALEALAWTDDTTRATALARNAGIEVKSGDATRRYLGTFRTSAIGQTEQSFGGLGVGGVEAKQFVWNRYNRRPWAARVADSTDSWSYTTLAWRAANASNAMRASFVIGLAEDIARGTYSVLGTNFGTAGVGLDKTNGYDGLAIVAPAAGATFGMASVTPAAGFHYLSANEYGHASGTFRGDDGDPAGVQSGLLVEGWA